MTDLLRGLIELNVLIIILALIAFSIRKYLSFGIQRKLIISIPLVAILIQVVKGWTYSNSNSTIAVIEPIFEVDLIPVIVYSADSNGLFTSFEIIYFAGLMLFLLWFLVKLFKVILFFRTAIKDKVTGTKLLITEQENSFSFFKFIHLSAHLEGIEKQVVLDHELIHVQKKHTLDIVIMEIYHSLFWFNPVFLWLKRSLVYVHEFEVDEQMYGKYKNDYVKCLLVQSLGINSSHLLLTSQFYNGLSLAKRTQKMKSKLKNKNGFLIAIPLFAIALIFTSWTSKTDVLPTVNQEVPKVYEKVDVYPQFKGGQEAMMKFIVENIKYPEEAKKNKAEGTAYIQFVVMETGKIKDAKVLKPIHDDLATEALRVVSSMPDWIPGQKDGKNVAVKYTIPIKFRL